MSIFNSLGSNYNFSYVVKTLFAGDGEEYFLRLKKLLQEKYGGNKVILTHKGRDALRIVLRAIGLRGKAVIGICGFTCFAVYEAIEKEGYKVKYLDIDRDSLNFSYNTLEKAVNQNSDLKVVIIQNTLGFTCEIEKISKFCKSRGIILVEDLAHSIGAKYNDGREVGTVGDFTILSFSQDKMIDGISGGALIRHNPKFRIENFEFTDIEVEVQKKDRFYPLYTYMIRKTYDLYFGRVIHFLLKKINFLSTPMISSEKIGKIALWYCQNIYNEFLDLTQNLKHRRNIASIYAKNLDSNLINREIVSKINNSSNLRFPIFINNREDVINYLKKSKIFVSDIWYDSPIAPRKYLSKTDYKKGTCKNAEYVSDKILNLPTHRNITERDAIRIVERVNKFFEDFSHQSE